MKASQITCKGDIPGNIRDISINGVFPAKIEIILKEMNHGEEPTLMQVLRFGPMVLRVICKYKSTFKEICDSVKTLSGIKDWGDVEMEDIEQSFENTDISIIQLIECSNFTDDVRIVFEHYRNEVKKKYIFNGKIEDMYVPNSYGSIKEEYWPLLQLKLNSFDIQYDYDKKESYLLIAAKDYQF